MKLLPIYQFRKKILEAMVDDEDWDKVSRYVWGLGSDGSVKRGERIS